MYKWLGYLPLVCWLSTSITSSVAQSRVLLYEDFSDPDSLSSWKLRSETNSRPMSDLVSAGAISFTDARLESPRYSTEALRYYRLDLRTSSSEKLLWGVVFFDTSGKMLLADHYSSVDPNNSLQYETFYFQSKANAVEAQL